jgi:alkanesulfonate monooxygenase SsuD/methylene tetrahydromethanopterin reductase-like flavin-dependent oxidoreductase (luciferase family)
MTGERSLRLAGEVADGTVLVGGTTTEGVTRARGLIEEGMPAERRERHRIVQYLPTATGADAADRIARRGGSEGGAAGSAAVGDAAAVAETVRRYAAAGADTVVLQPTVDDPEPEGFVRFAAEVARSVA